MFVDEFYFHFKRGLGRWERIGHPLDTLSFLSCFVWAYSLDTTQTTGFYILSALSTLIITKDEFVHANESPPGEQWLHSVLFIVHPIALFGLFKVWQAGLKEFILIQALIISGFGLYQFVYWNIIKKDYHGQAAGK